MTEEKNTPTFAEVIEEYSQKISILKKGHLQEKEKLRVLGKSFLGRINIKDIKSSDIAKYRDLRLADINTKTKKNISPSTVRIELSLISCVFNTAINEWDYCEINPVKNIRKPLPNAGRTRRLTPKEEYQIINYAKQHTNKEFCSILVLALESCMRQGEILNLRWENINFSTSVAHLPDTKNGSGRDVPLSHKAWQALNLMERKQEGKIYNYSPAGIKSSWRYMIEKLEIKDLHFHDLRHEAISRLFEKGTLDMMEISLISGHKSLAMLKRYTHLKAHKLVPKLNAPKDKNTALLLKKFTPYPASIMERNGIIKIKFTDFEDLEVYDTDRESATKKAKQALIVEIINYLKDGKRLPKPHENISLALELTNSVEEMISPM